MTETRIVETERQQTAVITDHVARDQLPTFFSRALTAVSETLAAEGVTPSGPPFACYHGEPREVIEVEAGFPVAEPVEAADAVLPGELPGGPAVEALHIGAYDHLAETYAAVRSRMEQEGLEPAPLMWEYYLTGPATDPDPATWRTRVVWPVRRADSDPASDRP
ncbi:MAG: transcription activator effector binding [Friedmanniella sp.]|nr:transcription activator effector binding [Friedmanniella sp.]